MKKAVALIGAAAVSLALGFSTIALADPPTMVTFCHIAGLASDPANQITLTLPEQAVYGVAGHFNENGTPNAGHEQDYLGPCNPPTETPPPPPPPTPTPSPCPPKDDAADRTNNPCPPPCPTVSSVTANDPKDCPTPTPTTPPPTTPPPPPPTTPPPAPVCEPSVTFGPWYGDPRINITLEGPGEFKVWGGIQRFTGIRVFLADLDCGEKVVLNRYKVKFGKTVYVELNGELYASRTAPRTR